MGDFNAHNSAWFSQSGSDHAVTRGNVINNLINDSNLTLLNENTPTRVSQDGFSSSPDLTIVTPHLSLGSVWNPMTTLNSDHLPIIIKLADWFPDPPTDPSRTYTNIRKARWPNYTAETELRFAREPPPTTCSAGEKRFRQILQTAAKHHIPAGYVRDRLETLPDEAKPLVRERDRLRTQNPSHPHIPQLNNQIAALISTSNRDKWKTAVESCNRTQDTGLLWKLIGTMTGKKPRIPPNQSITFNQNQLSDQNLIASAFCKQFTTIVQHTSDPEARRVRRQLLHDHPLDHDFSPFTAELVVKGIKESSNSTAAGPDDLTMLHLKHLGPLGIQYLTKLFNLSIQSADIPSI